MPPRSRPRSPLRPAADEINQAIRWLMDEEPDGELHSEKYQRLLVQWAAATRSPQVTRTPRRTPCPVSVRAGQKRQAGTPGTPCPDSLTTGADNLFGHSSAPRPGSTAGRGAQGSK
ncbi:hypothetical protein [Streptomyces sp. NBC_00572]|uniref:hypothetical protein n=1 Tax=Streptomyces sp. NBC_00572 TaxID=2903664 RepID=UPI0022503201|nr:hypothetical protein [Streptomyces sp. NBC_00572]MCX4986921.1 hypothetical protein [Streptomyces sp. NBC_00572]